MISPSGSTFTLLKPDFTGNARKSSHFRMGYECLFLRLNLIPNSPKPHWQRRKIQ
ncbi:hypothetical protein DPMN_064818 [Dreissena polymorpha]|uniref:Uncharacterized protein n=1 Tax=Dreissena polymorpha TaxID=45954 RepID=A0A9D4CDU7_DREPO|nr:hypothetical protein DPMN_064818 [Dreissena polymorpha]